MFVLISLSIRFFFSIFLFLFHAFLWFVWIDIFRSMLLLCECGVRVGWAGLAGFGWVWLDLAFRLTGLDSNDIHK